MFRMSEVSSRSTSTINVSGAASSSARTSWAIRRLGLEPEAADQVGPHRPAHQSATHDARRGRGERQRPRAPKAGLLEHRREGEPGGGPTDQGHRAGHDAEQRVLAEAERDGDAGEVLHEAEDRRQHQEDQHLDAAHPEQGQARAHADGGEEGDAEGGLKGGVELDADAPARGAG